MSNGKHRFAEHLGFAASKKEMHGVDDNSIRIGVLT
jgi:hypothetical protein